MAYANIYPLLTMWFTIITYSFEARHPNHLKMHHCCLATDKVPILRPAMQIISNSVWSFLLNKQNHRQNPKLVPLFILIFSSKSTIHISENLTKLAVWKKKIRLVYFYALWRKKSSKNGWWYFFHLSIFEAK